MAKRARAGSGAALGGGTGDVKPQFLTLTSGDQAPDTFNVVTFALPVPRFGTMKSKATVFEILSLDWYLAPALLTDGVHAMFGYLTTSPNRSDTEPFILQDIAIDVARPQTFGAVGENNILIVQGGLNASFPQHVDLTDGAGNGILIATDSLSMVMGNVDNSANAISVVKVKYRLTNVGISEYVGIVQSQQV